MTYSFMSGKLDMFTGSLTLGDCFKFPLEDDRAIPTLKIRHDLPDGWMGSLIRIILDDSTYVDCDVEGQFLDSDNEAQPKEHTFHSCTGFDKRNWIKTTSVEELIGILHDNWD